METFKLSGFRHRKKIAAFDFDFTLVRPKMGRTFPKDVDDWEWLRPNVVETIQNLYNEKKYCIMVFTNQTKPWKADLIKRVVEALKIPVLVCIAFDKSLHKPLQEM
jgi:bifunctional polynucleotide phosphatase/kinase